MMNNALTIDVEDYYMVSAFADKVKFEEWPTYESRVERNTYMILDLLEKSGVIATFFILGWVAERHPKLVRDIYTAKHEIACHGYNHRLIYDLTPRQFREDTIKAKDILENIVGTEVKGYRAASYSIIKETLWALDVLIETGFRYDSSIFPIHHDRYGLPDAKRFVHVIERPSGSIVEIPPSTWHIYGHNIPVGGGGYLRLYPRLLTEAVIRRINTYEKEPAILYVHPWEIDIDQPRINGKWLSILRHYINIDSTLPKLASCLSEFNFQPLINIINSKFND